MKSENRQPRRAVAAIKGGMILDREGCYRAMQARDPRFDGRFFVAVRTTGIYCRPVCRVRLPRLENVEFYGCAAAAEEAGFRACRRCRPESAPGSPAWSGTSSTVARAMRLIDTGALDEEGVEDLASRLGVGERHLRRLFDEHVGASPTRIALSRRLHLARRLLDDPSIRIVDAAFAAGFTSLRTFNEAMRRAFGAPPSALRAKVAAAPRTRSVTLRFSYRPPYDWEAMLAFLAARAVARVESVNDGIYRRALSVGPRRGTLEIAHDGDRRELVATVTIDGVEALGPLARQIARVFDCGADPSAVAATLGRDPMLAPLVAARPGLRVASCWNPFEALVRAILGQQVSVAGAHTLLGRLAERYGEEVSGAPGAVCRTFPSPAALAETDVSTLGIPRARAEALREAARAVASGDVELAVGTEPREAVAALTRLRGIGAWTAEYVAMRGLGDPDAMPHGDLGLLRALRALGDPVTARRLEERSQAWRPWRAYATLHLWQASAARELRSSTESPDTKTAAGRTRPRSAA